MEHNFKINIYPYCWKENTYVDNYCYDACIDITLINIDIKNIPCEEIKKKIRYCNYVIHKPTNIMSLCFKYSDCELLYDYFVEMKNKISNDTSFKKKFLEKQIDKHEQEYYKIVYNFDSENNIRFYSYDAGPGGIFKTPMIIAHDINGTILIFEEIIKILKYYKNLYTTRCIDDITSWESYKREIDIIDRNVYSPPDINENSRYNNLEIKENGEICSYYFNVCKKSKSARN